MSQCCSWPQSLENYFRERWCWRTHRWEVICHTGPECQNTLVCFVCWSRAPRQFASPLTLTLKSEYLAVLHVVSVFRVRKHLVLAQIHSTILASSLCTTWIIDICPEGKYVDRSSSGQGNRAALHNLASSWFQWHMIDSSWWGGYKPLIFPSDQEEDRKHFFSFSVNSLRLIYLVSCLPTYFGILQNMLPPKRLSFYLCSLEGNALPKLFATLSTCSLFCEKYKLTSKQFIKNLDANLPAILYVFYKL